MTDCVIDVTRLFGRLVKGRLPTGVDRVSLAYVEHYGPRAHAVLRWARQSVVLPRGESAALFRWLLAPTSIGDVCRIVTKGALARWKAPKPRGRVFFNTGHSGLEKPFYAAMLKRQGVLPVFMVHDLIPISHPEYCRAGERDRHLARMRTVLSAGRAVVCNSQDTQDALMAFAADERLPMPPSAVAHLAPGMSLAAAGPRPMAEPYFVILGTIEPRKNHWMLLQVWRSLVERLGTKVPRLVVIGQRGWECENVVDLLERCEVLRGVVIERPSCSDAELATYLHHAQALLFPSFAEGYGMPLVEALAGGVPVIASDLGVFREIAGDLPDMIHPLDGMRWAETVRAYVGSDSLPRAAQMRRLAGFTAPSWSAHFARVDALLDQLKAQAAHG